MSQMNRPVNLVNSYVPISRFNQGEANKIFSEVKEAGPKIVMKNNTPICVLVDPSEYDRMMQLIESCQAKPQQSFQVAEQSATYSRSGDSISADVASLSDYKELELIKNVILETIAVKAIYLFGSRAYGTPHKDSDFDLYVTISDGAIRPIDAMLMIGNALQRHTVKAVDVLVGKESTFRERKELPTLERVIDRDGVKLYEAQ